MPLTLLVTDKHFSAMSLEIETTRRIVCDVNLLVFVSLSKGKQ